MQKLTNYQIPVSSWMTEFQALPLKEVTSRKCRHSQKQVRIIIAPVIEDYKSGKITYAEAEFNARVKIYQSVNPNFNPDVEYMKDPIYETVADNVQYIFKLCPDGLGPTQIAKRLTRERILSFVF